MKIVIVRNEHPNEVCAFIIAKMFYKALERRGYNVVLETAPVLATEPLGLTLGYMKGIYSLEEIRRFGNERLFKKWLRSIRGKHGEARYLNFHGQENNRRRPYLIVPNDRQRKEEIVVEVPSLYRPMKNPKILEASEKVLEILYGNETKTLEVNRWYITHVGDVKGCREERYFDETFIDCLIGKLRSYIE